MKQRLDPLSIVGLLIVLSADLARADNNWLVPRGQSGDSDRPGVVVLDATSAVEASPSSETIIPPVPGDPLIPPSPADNAMKSTDPVQPRWIGKAVPLEGETAQEQVNRVTAIWMLSAVFDNADGLSWLTLKPDNGPLDPSLSHAGYLSQPSWAISWLSGPRDTDIPARVYQFTIPLHTNFNFDDDWYVDLGITPGWFTDGVNRRPEMFRLPGFMTLHWTIDDSRKGVIGFTALPRDDIPFLPIVGFVDNRPEDGRRYEWVFPRPRGEWRVAESSWAAHWLTLTGELGGGSWAFKRDDRTPDVLTYRELRMLLGLERRSEKGRKLALEVGWVFDRELETRTGRGDRALDDALLTQFWLEY